ncbi:uncharacterized protein BDZ99DRAFT_259261 [Mytilinidion resinicola]|uniref:N-acetyltransferase domain-containing protein n=1 Tax=Mytilinidion resinicola TaxID=574789 RepID=A0A6A6YXR3_9PEZI|nr:uncharacterized protein BDZ99DRAFT_259261 [Mytilinidion resinicola]KAF2813570.1 hypothetical protein BDZ99DRAFT_259261 [Mytilinidion resinicola]
MSPTTTRIHLLPPTPPTDRTIEICLYHKLTALRHAALRSSPAAFSPLYRQEAFKCTTPDGRAEAWTFAAVQGPCAKNELEKDGKGEGEGEGDGQGEARHGEVDKVEKVQVLEADLDALVSGEWVGIVTLIAPPPAGDERRWEINWLYVLPHARRKGMGRRLLEAAVGYGVRESRLRGRERAGFRLQVATGNVGVVGWYERLGWRVRGECVGGLEMERWVGGEVEASDRV